MLRKIFSLTALCLGLAAVSFAGNPKSETKDANAAETKLQADPQWFHFVGNAASPSDLNNPAKYMPSDAPECESQTLQYRCDILAEPSTSNVNQPNLSTITAERKRSTATE